MKPHSQDIMTALVALLLAVSCDTHSSADSRSGDSTTSVAIDLGRQSPRVMRQILVALSPLDEPARLQHVESTCGCVAADVRAGDRELQIGDPVPAGTSLRLRVNYEGQGKEGLLSERVLVRFSARQETARILQREVILTGTLDERVSLRRPGTLRVSLLLPDGEAVVPFQLARALRPEAIRIEGVPAEVVPMSEGGRRLALRFRAGDVAGERTGRILLSLDDGRVERVDVLVRSYALQTLNPQRVSARLPHEAVQQLPVVVHGPSFEFDPDAVAWEHEPPVLDDVKLAKATNDRPHLELRPASRTSDAEPRKLILSIRASGQAGLYEGRALVRPHAEATYRIPLSYSVRVFRPAPSRPSPVGVPR